MASLQLNSSPIKGQEQLLVSDLVSTLRTYILPIEQKLDALIDQCCQCVNAVTVESIDPQTVASSTRHRSEEQATEAAQLLSQKAIDVAIQQLTESTTKFEKSIQSVLISFRY